ncbi:MAG: PepSY domain-containing protein [Paracoccaceae bacterium]
MKRTLVLSTALILTATMGLAKINTDALVADYQAMGYTRIEVKTGPTQTKVEAIRGTEKLEVIYDSGTGSVLKSETETVDSGDDLRPGVEIDSQNRDFVRVKSSSSDDEGSDDDSDDEDDDNDDDSDDDHDSDDDNDDDDDSDDDSGDDSGDDDDN